MSEGWTTTEAARAEKWCVGKGYERGTPVCERKAVVRTSSGRWLCQRCALGKDVPAEVEADAETFCDECACDPCACGWDDDEPADEPDADGKCLHGVGFDTVCVACCPEDADGSEP